MSSFARGPFLEAPSIGGIKRFESCTVKLSAKETIWTSLEVRTHPSFLDSLISKYDFGPGISGPLRYRVFREKRPQGPSGSLRNHNGNGNVSEQKI